MIGKLSKLFRISLSEGQLFILFGEELEHGRLFHELQRERYKNNIRFLQQVSHPHKTLYVPKLILQPFIENAVKHGFNGSLHHADKPMEICIHTEVKQGTFYIYIDNNGNRLSDSFMKERNETSTGYGVRNVRERIQMYFGPEYGVELRDLDAGGVRVTIKLPEVRSLEKLESYNIQNRI